MLHPNRQGTLSEQAYDRLREDIIHLRLTPGQLVYEAELAESMSMSRTPVREAFRLLAAEGLVDVLPQKGVRISHISERKVEEARVVRESLEATAFVILTEQWDESKLRFRKAVLEAESLLIQQESAESAEDPSLFLRCDEAFHQLFLEIAGNLTLLAMVQQMRGHVNRTRLLMLQELNQMPELIEEHRALFAAVRRNDGLQVSELLIRHFSKMRWNFSSIVARHPNYFEM